MKKQSGFTLVEFLMVVTIIGILSALAVPIYTDNVRKTKVKEAVDTIGALEDEIGTYLPGATTTDKSAAPLVYKCRPTENGDIGSGITASFLPGLEPPWGEPSGEDGFDTPPMSIWRIG